jgi:TIGR03009 family protein
MRAVAVWACLTAAVMTPMTWGQLPEKAEEREKWRDAVLKNWETVMSKVETLEAVCERTTEDKVYKTKEIYRGSAKYMKGNGPGLNARASLFLQNVEKPQVFEQFVLSGAFFYEAAPASKEIRVHELPQPKPGENADLNLVGLLFGMKAEEATKRYQIELAAADNHYFYLQVTPKLDKDKADFAVARLALVRTTYLPRLLEFQQPNKNVVRWDLPTIQTPANNLRAADFQAPQLPAGWKMNRIPAGSTPGPTKVRSASN